MQDTGLALTVFKRPNHTRQVLESIKLNGYKKIYIFQDGPRGEEDMQGCAEVSEIIRGIDWAETELHISAKNKGCRRSIIDAVTYVLERHNSMTCVEDDVVLSKGYKKFMDAALTKYEHDKRVFTAAGLQYDPIIPPDYKYDAFFQYRSSSWAWSTWKDRWAHFREDASLIEEVQNDMVKAAMLDMAGSDLKMFLKHTMSGAFDTWDVFWALTVINNKAVCVYPKKYLAGNIGFDGSGTNASNNSNSHFYNQDQADWLEGMSFPPDVVVDSRITWSHFESYDSTPESVKLPNIIKLIEIAVESGFRYTARIFNDHTTDEIFASIAHEVGADAAAKLYEGVMGRHRDNNKTYPEVINKGVRIFGVFDVANNLDEYYKVFDLLEDDMSKTILNTLLLYRVLPIRSFLTSITDTANPHYFDKRIITPNSDEVFVDCGGYNGDTTESYISNMGSYKRIYVYEPETDNYNECLQNLSKYPNVIIRNAGVGEKSEVLSLKGHQYESSFVATGHEGKPTQVISLDEDITEPVTFIKMDVEGFEMEAIHGAKNHIQNGKPKLAISIYHYFSDLWEIPKLIHELDPSYKFFIRHYCDKWNVETVLYAV